MVTASVSMRRIDVNGSFGLVSCGAKKPFDSLRQINNTLKLSEGVKRDRSAWHPTVKRRGACVNASSMSKSTTSSSC
ncbi:hypothetical protein Q7C36_002130 [Tachysurus vachellii]|uniref:Uncharacterized protein n=1 Tax=Tachysurus vachellii TaxID=175792 RepID=A0AA88T8L4_TACVA|nr:hypothetical protein Q7C36_002130 [Tachysurus vachellii]